MRVNPELNCKVRRYLLDDTSPIGRDRKAGTNKRFSGNDLIALCDIDICGQLAFDYLGSKLTSIYPTRESSTKAHCSASVASVLDFYSYYPNRSAGKPNIILSAVIS